jgi:hypothetical protein
MQMILPTARDKVRNQAALEKFASGGAGTEELTGQVDVEHELPIGQAHLDQRRILLQTGVVDQNVKAAPGLDDLGEHRLDFVFPADVGANRQRFAAIGFNLFHHGLGAFVAG